MLSEASTSSRSHIQQQLTSIVWSYLNSDLYRSAVFYAERCYALYPGSHDARHLYATALLRSGQPHSAHHLVNLPVDSRCNGCLEIKAKCYTALGRHRQATEALEECLRDPSYTPTPSMSTHTFSAFPEQAVLHCRSGATAIRGNLPENARVSFRKALALNPLLWEAFEGLCSLGNVPDVDVLYPPRPPPVKAVPSDKPSRPVQVPVATGAGFFTPNTGSNGGLFRLWKPESSQVPPSSMEPPNVRDQMNNYDSSYYTDESFQYKVPPLPSKVQAGPSVQPPAVRALSSADEMGPVAKKLRSTVRQRAPPAPVTDAKLKSSKSAGAVLQGADDGLKGSKARARPALTIANIFSPPGRRTQLASTTSRSSATATATTAGLKSIKEHPTTFGLTRRSTRLLGGTGNKPKLVPKTQAKERRRAINQTRSNSDSDMEDQRSGDKASVPSVEANIPIDNNSWSEEQDRAAQEAYDIEIAHYAIYNLTRLFAGATRALAMYDCRTCLEELEKLPASHQRSAWVMAMVGKAHYELGEYPAAERAFEAVRNLEPHRIWDMEVYSTLLWHLQRGYKLSFLAQELLSIDSQSPQAWIAVGNCFSLQKERVQALTCFQRASQLDPTCAYAYTLSGHESIDEDLDKAISFFEFALRVDQRHYNAWYGLGTCYMRMGKLRQAEYHYRRAADIHPQNAVLLGCVGMVNERKGKLNAALNMFDRAVRLSPDNALVRYHRAKILISLKQYKLAVKDLEALRDTSPDESNVIFQLARVYRLMGDKVKSAQMLAVARDVSPKSLNKIRKLLETVRDEDEVMDEG